MSICYELLDDELRNLAWKYNLRDFITKYLAINFVNNFVFEPQRAYISQTAAGFFVRGDYRIKEFLFHDLGASTFEDRMLLIISTKTKNSLKIDEIKGCEFFQDWRFEQAFNSDYNHPNKFNFVKLEKYLKSSDIIDFFDLSINELNKEVEKHIFEEHI